MCYVGYGIGTGYIGYKIVYFFIHLLSSTHTMSLFTIPDWTSSANKEDFFLCLVLVVVAVMIVA